MQKNRTLFLFFVSILLGTMAETCTGQVERYELGKRLRRFEEAWQQANPEQRLKSTPAMQQAVTSFFGLQLKTAAARLDQAWMAVRDRETPAWQRACAAYRIELEKAIFELQPSSPETTSAPTSISLKLKSFYDTKVSLQPEQIRATWDFIDRRDGKSVHQHELEFQQACVGFELPIQTFPVGDYQVRCRLKNDTDEFTLLETSFSVLTDLDTQLANIERVQRDQTLELNRSVRATLKEYQDLIQQGREPFAAETDYPFRRILELTNRVLEKPADSSNFIAESARTGAVWLMLMEGRKRVPVRIQAPSQAQGKLPVLFLFHGAGGSENMFFETYGAGQAVQMGLERGWLVVAPRQGLMGLALDCDQMLDSLEPFFEIDREQVFLLGHSMGAAQVIQQVGLHPDLPRAAAAIGGGRPTRDAKRIAQVGWFVSAGELDFGRSGAKAFHQSLLKAGAAKASYVEVPGIEHMVIVQAALPQAFEFFDKMKPVE